jgi:hypothetical protein
MACFVDGALVRMLVVETVPKIRWPTVWEVFEEERPNFVPYRGCFDGFHALPASEVDRSAGQEPG